MPFVSSLRLNVAEFTSRDVWETTRQNLTSDRAAQFAMGVVTLTVCLFVLRMLAIAAHAPFAVPV